MVPTRKPRIGCSTCPRAYSSRSSSRDSTTAGVIQPAHTLSRGNACLSMTSTSRPARRSCRAQVEPAGPPPTTRTSHRSAGMGLLLLPVVLVGPGPRHTVTAPAREQHLEQLHFAGPECGLRPAQVQPPGAHEALVVHFPHALARVVEPPQPVLERQRVVQAQVLHVQHREPARLEYFQDLPQRRRVGPGENPFLYP